VRLEGKERGSGMGESFSLVEVKSCEWEAYRERRGNWKIRNRAGEGFSPLKSF